MGEVSATRLHNLSAQLLIHLHLLHRDIALQREPKFPAKIHPCNGIAVICAGNGESSLIKFNLNLKQIVPCSNTVLNRRGNVLLQLCKKRLISLGHLQQLLGLKEHRVGLIYLNNNLLLCKKQILCSHLHANLCHTVPRSHLAAHIERLSYGETCIKELMHIKINYREGRRCCCHLSRCSAEEPKAAKGHIGHKIGPHCLKVVALLLFEPLCRCYASVLLQSHFVALIQGEAPPLFARCAICCRCGCTERNRRYCIE